MGTDIRLFVETKNNGKWESIQGVFNQKDRLDVVYGDGIYFEREYKVYAILANVRNGDGVDGPNTGEIFTPISLPKGLPIDASYYIETQYRKQSLGPYDAHDCSWLLLEEILAYDWNKCAKVSAYVSKEDAENFHENGIIPGPMNRKHRSNRILMLGYEKIEWDSTYAVVAGRFYTEVIPKLMEYGSPENIRIVFWFNS